MDPVKIAIPNKGRLSEETLSLLKLFATARDGTIQVLFLRAQDIPEFVADGVVHLGVTGLDIVAEAGRKVETLLDLGYGSCRLCVAVPEDAKVKTAKDYPRKVTVATSFPNLTKKYFEERKIKARIIPVSGATEITPHIGIADMITDLTSTGSTLVMNGLREVDTILKSTAHVIGAPGVRKGPYGKLVQDLLFALESVVAARAKRYLLADVPRSELDEIRRFLPGIAGPTVVEIAGNPNMVAIHVVVDEDEIYDAVARLKKLGARGILVMPIDRLVA